MSTMMYQYAQDSRHEADTDHFIDQSNVFMYFRLAHFRCIPSDVCLLGCPMQTPSVF